MRIIFNNEKGVSVLMPSPEFLDSLSEDLTLKEKMVIIAKRNIPENVEYHIIKKEDLPTDTTFRNAWEIKNKKINVNLDKAKEITKERLRTERKLKLEQLDIDFVRALEENKDTSEIVKEKQRLRDITKVVDKKTTVDDLKIINICNFKNNKL